MELKENVDSKSPKIIVIVGATGTGKTKLGAELAYHLNGEVISADSMQIYEGLDIATNKATKEEMMDIPHHLIGFLSPKVLDFNVYKFVDLSIPLIEDIHKRGKTVIVVGGTNQYIENLVWNGFVSEIKEGTTKKEGLILDNGEISFEKLKEIDPMMAEKLHPNDKRKIKRSLEIFLQTGTKQSAFLQNLSHTLRYNVCMIWVDTKKPILYQRLDQRIDSMIQRGLIQEIEQLKSMNIFQELSISEDYSKGIFQAIGYKEFLEYLNLKEDDPEKSQVLSNCIEKLKSQTRRYSRMQTGWIENRFLARINIHKLDSSDPLKWKEKVLNPALSICKAFLLCKNKEEEKVKLPQDWILLCKKDSVQNLEDWKKFFCESCKKELNGKKEWEVHLKSKKHKQTCRRIRKQNENPIFQQKSKHKSNNNDNIENTKNPNESENLKEEE